MNRRSTLSSATSGPSTRRASLSIHHMPERSQSIIIAQIHGADDISSVPYVMMHYRDGDLRVVVKQKQKGSDLQSYPLLTGVPLNERFDLTISDIGNGQMAFSTTYNGQTRQATSPVPDA